MISIVIPCYNSSSTLAQTIASALDQTIVAKEIIVVDDGSTDRTFDVIKSFGSKIIANFLPHQGVSFARERGRQLARGDYIQYLDSDDLLVTDTLKQRIEALERTGADIAYTDWGEFNTSSGGTIELGNKMIRPITLLEPDAEAACATAAFWAPPAAILYRRRIVEAIGGWHTGLPIIQDARYLFDAARTGARFTRVEGIGACYRVSANSLSRSSPDQFIRDCFVNATEIQAIWRKDGPLSEVRRQALIQMWSHLTAAAFRYNLPEFCEALRQLRTVSGRPHLGMHLRLMTSLVAGRRAVSETEQRIRSLLSPLRRLSPRLSDSEPQQPDFWR